ncbi:LAFE_0F06898g1_1 [Lachancea fermentati]|uniref:LAFE_0F06898g1_1 n=1 Tax=Lachancea fermentati TaxID=4955 RepID=A0A1G4MFE0_LACFM|nr:LAFE_0F06898g1_1 [Lachancea fermentati]
MRNASRRIAAEPQSPVPTLIPFEGDIIDPGPITPSSASPSVATTDNVPSYHEIIENHRGVIDRALTPLVKRFTVYDDHPECIDGYRIVKCIGKGQFGQVYLAQSKTLEQVAVKCIQKRPRNSQQYSMNQVMRQMRYWKSKGKFVSNSEDAIMQMNVSKIRWEVYIANRLRHKNILHVLECLDSPSSRKIWIITPWSSLGELRWERGSKSQTLDQWNRFLRKQTTVEQFSEIVLKNIVDGLLYLSKQGCIHRDIKPSNILLDGTSGEMKISDFGSSLISPEFLPFKDQELAQGYMEEIHKIVGTPAFIAPELCDFSAKTTFLDGFKLDVWSLGVTMYCLLENKLPFWGDNEFDTFHKIVRDRLPKNGNWLHDLIVTRLLEKSMSERISIDELSTLLKKSRKKHGVKNLMSKFRNFATKKKNPSTTQFSSIHIDEGSSDFNLDTSSSSIGSSFGEPVQISEFVKSPTETVKPESGTTTDVERVEILSETSNQQSSIPITPEDTRNEVSPSPIKVDTPLKELIRSGNTPEKDLELMETVMPVENKSLAQTQEHSHILSSRGTIDFKRYFRSPSKASKTRSNQSQKNSFASKDSIEDIRKYLDYADT